MALLREGSPDVITGDAEVTQASMIEFEQPFESQPTLARSIELEEPSQNQTQGISGRSGRH